MAAIEISDQGIIEKLVLPEGFLEEDSCLSSPIAHNYLSFQAKGSGASICYEQSTEPHTAHDVELVQKLLAERFEPGKGRRLNLEGGIAGEPDDSDLFAVLCMCFVFGGGLTKNGCVVDMDRCSWELRTLGNEDRADSESTQSSTMILGRLKFVEATGKRSRREVLLALPIGPNEVGCGYIWLEGNSSEIRRYEQVFLGAIASGTYKHLIGA